MKSQIVNIHGMAFRVAGIRSRGFSLVEVVLALAVMTVALMTVLGMVPIGLNSVQKSMQATAQTHIVQSLLNEAYSADRDRLQGSTMYYDDIGQRLDGPSEAWAYRVRTALVPVELVDQGDSITLPGETFLIGLEARTQPAPNPDWQLGPGQQVPQEVSIHSAVLKP